MSAINAINKLGNEYAEVLGDLYAVCPKAVLAAIAVSFTSCGGDHLDEAKVSIISEWSALHTAGIVPQAPPAKFLKQMPDREAEFQADMDEQAAQTANEVVA